MSDVLPEFVTAEIFWTEEIHKCNDKYGLLLDAFEFRVLVFGCAAEVQHG